MTKILYSCVFAGCKKVLNVYIPPLRFYFSVVLGRWFWYNVGVVFGSTMDDIVRMI